MYLTYLVQVMAAAQAEWEESVKDAVQADDEGAEYDPVFEARSAALDASATLLKTMKQQLQAHLPLIIAHHQPVSVLGLEHVASASRRVVLSGPICCRHFRTARLQTVLRRPQSRRPAACSRL